MKVDKYQKSIYNCLTEDDTLTDGQKTIKIHKHIILLSLRLTVEVELLDTLHGQLLLLQGDLIRIRRELRGENADMLGECSREQQGLNWNSFRDQAKRNSSDQVSLRRRDSLTS